ncbi:anti-sigma factor [Streptomyces sp. WM6368]|uniref:anti-sigma factor n=1 Tax=Streptomyces sp. WM6368 TaxID=1415554 RepID=UPI0006AED6E4|nr:anti-sigma factor [Streptomyces sp. WM6368]KOU12723.1 anti-sigma-K factor RskA [Streptomyces sp. WM6368]
MSHRRTDLHTLTAAYALDALEPAEREAFTPHLAACEACRRETAEFRATAARMAAAVAEAPPTAMRQRTMTAVGAVRQLPPRVAAGAPAPALRSLRRRAVPLALVAGLAVAVAFAGLTARQHQEGDDIAHRARQAEQRLDAVSAVLAAPDARTVHGRAGNGALGTVIASDQLDQAVFAAAGLPAPAAGQTYQLWLAHDGTMRPAGFIHGDGAVLMDGSPSGATAVGLTLEPAEGSVQPTTTPLLLMPLAT